VFISFVYLISNGALDWGPIRRVRPVSSDAATRTTTSTVRRVGPSSGEAA
jgi:NADH-quinone oxidoreductase subunit A